MDKNDTQALKYYFQSLADSFQEKCLEIELRACQNKAEDDDVKKFYIFASQRSLCLELQKIAETDKFLELINSGSKIIKEKANGFVN